MMLRVYWSWKYGTFGLRIGQVWVCLKAHWNAPLFSERYGYRKPVVKIGGWRLIVERKEDGL